MSEHNNNNVETVHSTTTVHEGRERGRVNYYDDYVYTKPHAGANISWASLFAGAVTFIALSILLSLIGSAIGFGVPTLTAANPLEGLSASMIAWAIISLIVSLGGAGFVAGLASGRAGFIHGFLTWALSLFLATWLTLTAASGIFGFVGDVIGSTLNVAGDAVTNVVDTTGTAVSELSQGAFDAIVGTVDNIDADVDVAEEIRTALANSDVEQLQPEFLESQIDDTITEVSEAGRRIIEDKEDPEKVFNEVTSSIQARIENITADLNRDDLVDVITSNTDLDDEQAEEAIDQVIEQYNAAAETASNALAEAETALNELGQEAENFATEAVQVTEDVTNEISKYSLYAFLGMLLAAVLTTYMGKAGVKTAKNHRHIFE